ncbi:MAG: hypothetical protein P1U89_00580 [Verrucomicrobiales bacterium]|nr:hypothetical protein [Verrucomicrobiales bacterium]
METNGAEFLKKIDLAREELTHLSQKIYGASDVNSVLATIGTKTELFFKAILFPSESPWRPFKYFINCLDGIIDPEEIEELQAFRRTYNLARHNPRFRIGVIEALRQVNSVKTVLRHVFDIGVGGSNQTTATNTRRVYWLSAWEHMIGDDIEIHIIVPGESENLMGPPELDMIRIDSKQWEAAKISMAEAGRLDEWQGHIPEEYVKAWNSLGDFVEAIAFEGEYRELLICLAQFEKYLELMPGTNRSDSSKNVLVACLVALVDVMDEVPNPKGIAPCLTRQVISAYALPESAIDLKEIAEDLARVARLAWDDLQPLIGPLWASRDEFQELKRNSIACSDKFPVIIDANRRLIALHS